MLHPRFWLWIISDNTSHITDSGGSVSIDDAVGIVVDFEGAVPKGDGEALDRLEVHLVSTRAEPDLDVEVTEDRSPEGVALVAGGVDRRRGDDRVERRGRPAVGARLHAGQLRLDARTLAFGDRTGEFVAQSVQINYH